MTSSAVTFAPPRAGNANLVPPSLTASPSRPPKKGDPRVRCAQTREGPQTSYLRRYVRLTSGRGRHRRQCPRPRWRHVTAGKLAPPFLPVAPDLGRSGVCGGPHHLGVGPAALAERPFGDCQAAGRDQGVPASPKALDCGTHLRLVGPVPPSV